MDEAPTKHTIETSKLNVDETEKQTDIKNVEQINNKTDSVSFRESTENININIKSATTEKSLEKACTEIGEKSNETKEDKMINDDDGEDLPDNFFDDFSNNDFMAGLDIVDDWMDDEDDPDKRRERDDYFQDDAEVRSRSSERKHDKRESSPWYVPNFMRRGTRYVRDDDKYRRNRERSFEKRSRDREHDRRRSRDREFERRRSRSRERFRDERRSRERFRSHENSRPREHEKHSSDIRNSKNNSKDRFHNRLIEENIDSRRDPEKTKRDIQRDKLRCAKDFEARVFQEQIKVAESGLVPPGTELDVVLEHEKRKQEEEEQKMIDMPLERKKEEPSREPLTRPIERKRSTDRFRCRDDGDSKNHGRQSRDLLSRERRSRERTSRDKHSFERRSRERRSRERHSREKQRSRERRSRERRSRVRRSLERRSRERIQRERERELRKRRLSPDFRTRKREYSRLERSKDRSLSPRLRRRSRSLDREELLRRNDDLRLRIREKRREKFFNELSPVSEAKLSRSPSLSNLSLISNISEREFWLRNREKYKSRNGRSCSPISSSSDLGSPRRKRSRKATFMEEIERKLREKSKRHATQVSTNSDPPQPVPPPQQPPQLMTLGMNFPPQNPQMFTHAGIVPNPYSQPQVIGHGMMMHQHQHQHQQMHHGMPMVNLMSAPMSMGAMRPGPNPGMVEQPMMPMPQVMNPLPMQVQQPVLNSPPVKHDSNLHRTSSNLKPCVSDANKEVTKLFEEQKISLSDYLSVSAKPIDPKLPPINVHKKIKVISKCQDVIRVLKEDSKFCGRFFPKPTPPGFNKQEETSVRWKSPLRKTFPVRFMFTTPCKKTPTQQEFVKNIINKLLFVCGIRGIPETPTVRSAGAKSINASTNPKPPLLQIPTQVTSASTAPKLLPAPVSFTVSQQKPKNTPLPQQSVLIKRSSIGLQTDPVKCQICEIRSARKFSDESCQTTEKEMVDESTQVTNEDLQKSMVTFTPRGILKNSGTSLQSLSHLTPAQLMALQQEGNNDDGWSIASRNETFTTSRNQQDTFASPTGNFMGRNPNNSSFNSTPNMGRLNSGNMSSGSFSSSFSGSPEKFPFSNNMANRSFGGNQSSPMNPGNTMGDFQNMGNRNVDNRTGNFERFSNDRYSPEDSFSEPNMNYNRNMSGSMGGNIPGNMGGNMGGNIGGNIGTPMNSMSNRGRGGTSNRGGFYNMGNYGGQNRPFYN